VEGWRKLQNEELRNLHALQNIRVIKEDEVGGSCSTHGIDEKCIHDFHRKT
jgi:hypothetical protein